MGDETASLVFEEASKPVARVKGSVDASTVAAQKSECIRRDRLVLDNREDSRSDRQKARMKRWTQRRSTLQ